MLIINVVFGIIAFVPVVGAIAYSRETDRLAATNVATAVAAARKACAAEIGRLDEAVARERARAQQICDAQARGAYQYEEQLAALREQYAKDIAGRNRLDEATRRRWRRVDQLALAANPAWRSDAEVAAAVDRFNEALDGDALVETTPVPDRQSEPVQSGTRVMTGKREVRCG